MRVARSLLSSENGFKSIFERFLAALANLNAPGGVETDKDAANPAARPTTRPATEVTTFFVTPLPVVKRDGITAPKSPPVPTQSPDISLFSAKLREKNFLKRTL